MPSCEYSTLGKISETIEKFRNSSSTKEKFEPTEPTSTLKPEENNMIPVPFTGEGKCSGPLVKYLLPEGTPINEQAALFVDKDNYMNICKSDKEGVMFVIPLDKLSMFS